MNPLTNMRNVKKLSEQELQRLPKSSWHDEYKSSAWIFVGGLPYDLSEGDIMAIFSQYGEITNLNLVRDKDTGKQKGFCFVCYEDQRSTVLAVDNFNGTRVLGRILRVDHVKDYKPPKSSEPTSKIKTEKLDNNDYEIKREFKTEIKQEILSPDIKREMCSPEIKREICTPEIKREICTPEIIRSPDCKNDKKKKSSKDKDRNSKKHSRNKSKERDTLHKYQRERSKEKDRKRYYKNDSDESYDREKHSKKSRRNKSREREISKNLKTKSYKEHNSRDKSKERSNDFRNKDYDEKNNKKQKNEENYKKYKK